jgi:hypothetical protein
MPPPVQPRRRVQVPYRQPNRHLVVKCRDVAQQGKAVVDGHALRLALELAFFERVVALDHQQLRALLFLRHLQLKLLWPELYLQLIVFHAHLSVLLHHLHVQLHLSLLYFVLRLPDHNVLLLGIQLVLIRHVQLNVLAGKFLRVRVLAHVVDDLQREGGGMR